MLKFFRKIRQGLLQEGSFQKYLLYAAGEILLVMIGILLALQINNWNERKNTQKLEIEYLVNLKQEYQNNADALQAVVVKRAKVIESINRLIVISDSVGYAVDEKDWNELVLSFQTYGSYVFSAKTPILEEIKNSGNIVNITNPKLRTLLTLWQQKMSGVFGTQGEIKKYRDRLTDILSEYGAFNAVLIPNYSYIDFSPSQHKMKQLAIWKNNLILLRDEFLYLQNDIYPQTKAYFEEVIPLIEKEIN